MAEDKQNLTLIVELRHKDKVIAHEEVVANEMLLELKEGSMMMEDAFSKVIHKAIPKAMAKFQEVVSEVPPIPEEKKECGCNCKEVEIVTPTPDAQTD